MLHIGIVRTLRHKICQRFCICCLIVFFLLIYTHRKKTSFSGVLNGNLSNTPPWADYLPSHVFKILPEDNFKRQNLERKFAGNVLNRTARVAIRPTPRRDLPVVPPGDHRHEENVDSDQDHLKEMSAPSKPGNCTDTLLRPQEDIAEMFEWQRVSADLLLFAAHFDPRLRAPPRIVIIGLTANYVNKTMVSQYGVCYVWYRGNDTPAVIGAGLTILPENHRKM